MDRPRWEGERLLRVMLVCLLGVLLLVSPGANAGRLPQGETVVESLADPRLVLQYQGRLLDPSTGSPKPDGSYHMILSLYDAATGGSVVWTEIKNVAVSDGLFTTYLGDTAPLELSDFDGRPLWLSVTVGADPEATPRQRVTHVAYALHAEDADTVDGQEAAEFAAADHHHSAGDISSGTLSTDRFSAYADLNAEASIGESIGQVAAGNHVHSGSTIIDGSIVAADLASNSVTSAKIAAGNVGYSALAANSIDTTKIRDLSVFTNDLAPSSVNSDKIANPGVYSDDLANNTVTSAHIANGGVATADLANSSVTTAKISRSGASTNHVLYNTGSSVAWGYAPGSEIRYTVLNVSCVSKSSFTSSYSKIANIGSVSKLDATSRLEVTFNGRINVYGMTGSGALFELRVDDKATTQGRAAATLKNSEVGYDGEAVSITGIFTGLGTGTRTISMWVRMNTGTGTRGGINSGCWTSDHLVVREIK